MKSKLLLCTLLSFITVYVYGQSAGDYRSKQNGNWNAATSWERFDGTNWVAAAIPPASSDGVITIRAGHGITVSATTSADQITVLASGSIAMDADLTLNDGTGDDLTINGTMHFNTGRLSGPGRMVVSNGGILNLGTGQQKLIGAAITNNGTMNWSGGTIYFRATGILISNAGSFNITGNNSLQNEGTDPQAAGTLANSGTITKTSTGLTDFQVTAVTNSGTFNINAGTIQNRSTFTNTGNLSFSNGVFTNDLNRVFNHNTGSLIGGTGSFTNDGTMNLNIGQTFSPSLSFAVGSSSTTTGAGNLTINNNFTMHGTIDGTGSLLINGNITWRGGTLRRPLTIAPANSLTFASPSITGEHNLDAAIINNGTMNWQDGTIRFKVNGILTNNGNFNISSDDPMLNENFVSATFTNAGTITKTTTSSNRFVLGASTVPNSGIINTSSGFIKGLGTYNIETVTPFINSGTIAPGLSPGILTIDNQQPLSASSTLSIEIAGNGGAGQPTGHDQLQRSGNLTLIGTLAISETGTVPVGDYTIISLTSGTISGTFTSTNLPANYSIIYNTNSVVARKGESVCLPAVLITAAPSTTICSGLNVMFTATPTNGGATPSYQWKLNGNNVGTNSNTYSNATLANGDQVTCVMTSSLACASPTTATSNISTMAVTPSVAPSVSIAANPGTNVCQTTPVTFTATPTNGGATPSYQWKVNGNNVGTNSNTFTATGLMTGHEVSCVMTSSLGCASPVTATSNTLHMTVTLLATSSVSISSNQGNTICGGTNVTFTATPTNGGATPSYQWTLNGSTVGTNSNTYSNSALANGDEVVVVMIPSLTCVFPTLVSSNRITMTVTATVAPSVSISANPGANVCQATPVTFTATPTNGGATPSYQWKLNGNNVGTNSNTFSNATLANGDQVICVMTSSLACASPTTATSNIITMAVTSSVTPSVSIAANPGTNVCQTTPVTFTATPTNGGATPSYQWKVNGNNVGTNSNTFTATGLMTGHEVSCVMTSSLGCASPVTATSNTLHMTVTLLATSSVSISSNQGNTICGGTNVTFTATPTNGGATPSYQWTLNGSTVGTNSNTYSNSGLANGDEVVVAMISSLTCVFPPLSSSNVIRMNVTTAVAPSVSISANPGNTICAGTNVTFTATPTNGGTPSYQWKLNNNNVGTNSNTYSNTGLANGDQVSCVMTSSLACANQPTAISNTIAMNVTSSVVPSVSISANPGNTICAGTNVTFTATPTNGGSPSYQWKLNGNNVGTNSNTYSNNVLVNGDQVSCVMTSSLDCGGSLSVTSNSIIISISSGNINASIVYIGNKNRCPQTLQANPGGDVSYQWYKNGIEISGATERRYVAHNDGSYTVSITKNGCSAVSGPADVTTCPSSQTNNNREFTREEPDLIPRDGLLLYPNPAADQVTINFQQSEKINGEATVQLVTIQGQVLITQKVHVIRGRINCTLKLHNAWRDQLYLVKIITTKKIYVGKLAKIVR